METISIEQYVSDFKNHRLTTNLVGIPTFIKNFAKKRRIEVVDTQIVNIFGIEHIKLISSEEDVIYTVEGIIHHEGYDAACSIIQDNAYSHLFWVKNGKLHRDDDFPAYIEGNSLIWFQNGLRHREGDKPAEIVNGIREIWYKNDKIHRDNGFPAWIEHISGHSSYWLNDKKVSKEHIESASKINNILEHF